MKTESVACRIVLVTGGTGVLGAEIVRALAARAEYSVVANFSRDEARAARLQRETGCELRRADIGVEEEVATLFASLPPLHAVVHAAGINSDALLATQSRAAWNETLRVNCDGAFLVTRAALQNMERGGRLIVLASRAGECGRAGQTAYAATKAAQIALVQSAAREGAAREIAVNAICPGFVPSAMNDELSTRAREAAQRESLWNEFGTARQVAGVVKWLLSADAVGISGQVFHCDSRL
jgi:3-oxoacyl-[acyl-carrier protein] reductase